MSFSEKVAAYLIKNKEIKNDDQQEILVFGAQVFFGLLSGIVITLLVGYLIKVHVQVFYMLLVSIFIRKTAGGAHSEDPFHCLLITVFVYNLLAYIAIKTNFLIQDYMGLIILFTFFYGAIVVYLKAPVESPQKPLSDQQKKILRSLSFLVVLSLLLFQSISYFYNGNQLNNYAISLIVIWQYLMLTSSGDRLMLFLDKYLNIIIPKRR